MHAERDFLRDVVFPELEERLHQYGGFLDPVDLRWGIDPSRAGDQESEERQILRLCLEEIDQSRPLFVGLLGERYGWVPDTATMTAALEGTGVPPDEAPESVTALEVRYGALAARGRSDRTLFYFRDLPLGVMAAEDQTHYCDRMAGREASARRLDQLKAEIRRVMPDRVRTYHAAWDSDRRRVTGLEDFGAAVLEDLWRVLQPELAARVAAGGWVAQTRRAHDHRIAELSADFVGRRLAMEQLCAFARWEGSPAPVLVMGQPGCGKSSLLAQVVHDTRRAASAVRVLYHTASASPSPRDLGRLLRSWEVELGLAPDGDDYAEVLAQDDRPTDQIAAEVLRTLSSHNGPVLLVVDGLDQLRELGESFLLDAPHLLPPHVRLIASCGVETDEPGWQHLRLGGLDAEEGAAMVHALLTRARKVLAPPVFTAMLERACGTADGNRLSPAWLFAAFAELQSLGEDDFTALATAGNVGVAGVNALLLQRSAGFPKSLEAMLTRRLESLERQLGEGVVAVLLTTLTGERGRFPSRLLPAVFRWFDMAVNDVTLARVRRHLRGWVTVSPDDGSWTVVSQPFLNACQARYLGDPETLERWHSRFGRFVESLKRSERGTLDNMWHWQVAFDAYDPVERACIDGDVLSMRAMLREGYDVQEDGAFGAPPLFTAVTWGTPDVVRMLLDAGADINARDQWAGATPLDYAFMSTRADARIIDLLLTRGAHLNPDESTGLLAAAAGTGRLDFVQLALHHGVDLLEEHEESVVMAASRRHWDVANWLACAIGDAGGPAWPVLNATEVAWLESARDGNAAVLNQLRPRVDPNCADAAGQTALHLAVAGHHLEAVAFLLGAGAAPNCADINGTTPLGSLHHFLDHDSESMVRLLLKGGADPSIADDEGHTPLHRAYRRPEVIDLLLAAGADPDVVNANGQTPLHWCASWITDDADAEARITITEALLAKCPGLRSRCDDGGRTAFDYLDEVDERTSREVVDRLAQVLTPGW
jgi:ankyrin repeat protein